MPSKVLNIREKENTRETDPVQPFEPRACGTTSWQGVYTYHRRERSIDR